MSAKEMFKKLGYIQEQKINWLLEYYIHNGNDFKKISFDLEDKTFHKSMEKGRADYITIEELQAINKQVEELGWNI